MKCRTCQTEFHSPVQTFTAVGRTIRLRPINCPRCIAANGKITKAKIIQPKTTTDLFA